MRCKVVFFTVAHVTEDVADVRYADDKSTAPRDPPIVQPEPAPDVKDAVLWETVVIGDVDHKVDGAAIQNYKRVISHGGSEV